MRVQNPLTEIPSRYITEGGMRMLIPPSDIYRYDACIAPFSTKLHLRDCDYLESTQGLRHTCGLGLLRGRAGHRLGDRGHLLAPGYRLVHVQRLG